MKRIPRLLKYSLAGLQQLHKLISVGMACNLASTYEVEKNFQILLVWSNKVVQTFQKLSCDKEIVAIRAGT